MSTKEKIFLAAIKERYCLNPGSERETYHLVISLEGSDIEYAVGDCLGIYPENDPLKVHELINELKVTGKEIVEDRNGSTFSLENFFLKKANLLRLPTNRDPHLSAFCKSLPPLLPRFYSIASSMQAVGREAHLTVKLIDGVCTQYLCKRAPLDTPILPIFHHPARQFSLPPESFDKPIMMVGPGTGIAPFRGFMQERMLKKCPGKNWLFFGERHRETDFFYKSYWEELVNNGQLELDCAFSRDQADKIYVQHRMLAHSRKIWNWLQEGAYFFVCGDASKMAKDIERTLQTIIEKEGGFSCEDAKACIKNLKKENRYQRDVY